MHCLGRGSCLRQLGESLDAQASGCKGGGIGGYWAMGIRTGIGSEHYHHPHTWMFAAWELGFYVYVHIVIEESYTTTSHWLGRGYPGYRVYHNFRHAAHVYRKKKIESVRSQARLWAWF